MGRCVLRRPRGAFPVTLHAGAGHYGSAVYLPTYVLFARRDKRLVFPQGTFRFRLG